MDVILIVYLSGLISCAVLGVVVCLFIFRELPTVLEKIIPAQNSAFFASFIKALFIITAFIGGISAKFYSCGYRYETLVDNPTALTYKVAGQVEGATRFLLLFLLFFTTLFFIVLMARDKKRGNPHG
jgi:hypothetical protein